MVEPIRSELEPFHQGASTEAVEVSGARRRSRRRNKDVERLEQAQVSDDLADRRPTHERLDVVPWARPREHLGELPGRAPPFLDARLHRIKSFDVVPDELIEASSQVGEPMLVSRQDLVGIKGMSFASDWRKAPNGLDADCGCTETFGVMRAKTWSPVSRTPASGATSEECQIF